MGIKINFGSDGGLSAESKRRLKALAGGKTLASQLMKAKSQKQRGRIALAAKKRKDR